jgi:dipeptidyl aminopeptidase/acylaminoacyl peptidase
LGKERVVRASEGTDDAPVFSPDGKWIAYMSTVATRSEIYIEPFPGNGDQWKVSSDGGSFPRWAPNGRELYFMRHQALYAVNLARGPANASPPTRLLDGPYVETFGHAFAVAPDGNRFLMLKPADARTSASTLTLVEGWLTEVEARIAAARPRTP